MKSTSPSHPSFPYMAGCSYTEGDIKSMIGEFNENNNRGNRNLETIDFFSFAAGMHKLMNTGVDSWGDTYDIMVASGGGGTLDATKLKGFMGKLNIDITAEEAEEMIKSTPDRTSFINQMSKKVKSIGGSVPDVSSSNGLSPPPAATASSGGGGGGGGNVDEKFAKYDKMRKMLPEGAVRQAMTKDGVSPADVDLFWNQVNGTAGSSASSGGGGDAPAARPPAPAFLAQIGKKK
jgi:hypothetical protein